ncbi:acyltransferase domain-containing protein [Rapidithrix thailandica]|uniref:Acyltransferase domain-containing protein n=1 Tax=Rapidithrix thailandica TaxID=413964 RepID=A0AAW9S1S6_9BACT
MDHLSESMPVRSEVVFLFSGQGSQFHHMGEELMAESDVFRNTMRYLDRQAQRLIGSSVIDYLYNQEVGRSQPFDRLLYSHPAVFMVQYALVQTLIQAGLKPDAVCGYSLGESVAAAVSEIADPLDILTKMIHQAKLVEEMIPKGGMLAILDDPVAYYRVPLLYTRSSLVSTKSKANLKQFVVAATSEAMAEIKQYLSAHNIVYHQLPVLYPYHSHHMDPLYDRYQSIINPMDYKKPAVTFVSAVYGQELKEINQQYWWDLLREPIHFQESIQYLEDLGAKTYIDISPSGEFTGYINLLKQEGSASQAHATLSPWRSCGMKNLKNIVSQALYGRQMVQNYEL